MSQTEPRDIEPVESFIGSEGSRLGPGRALFVIESPVECERASDVFLEALGPIRIAGEVWQLEGVMWHVPAFPVQLGERLMVQCRRAS